MSKELIGALIGLGGAIFGALVAGAIAIWTFRQSRRTQTADEFRDVLQSLVDLRIRTYEDELRWAQDAGPREFLSGALNVKRQLYKATAARMLNRASSELTANDFATLGYEYQSDSEFRDALRCYEEALARAVESTIERVSVLRNLGGLLLQPTTLHNRARGEGYFREAISLTNGQTDDYSRYTTGYTYEMLGMGLLANRYPDWREAIETARENYEAISPTNPLRQYALDGLELRKSQSGVAVAVPPDKPPPNRFDPDVLRAVGEGTAGASPRRGDGPHGA